MVKGRIAATVMVLVLGLTTDAQAERFEKLKGIDSFFLVVEDIVLEDPVSVKQITDAVELQLRSLGLPIGEEGVASLYVNVNIVEVGTDFAYHIGVAVDEMVRVIRSNEVWSVEVWSTGTVGLCTNCTNLDTREAILRGLKRKVADFALDYLRANPKE